MVYWKYQWQCQCASLSYLSKTMILLRSQKLLLVFQYRPHERTRVKSNIHVFIKNDIKLSILTMLESIKTYAYYLDILE